MASQRKPSLAHWRTLKTIELSRQQLSRITMRSRPWNASSCCAWLASFGDCVGLRRSRQACLRLKQTKSAKRPKLNNRLVDPNKRLSTRIPNRSVVSFDESYRSEAIAIGRDASTRSARNDLLPLRSTATLTQCFLRLADLPNYALDRLSRYEATLSRQVARVLLELGALDRRKPQERRRALSQKSSSYRALRELDPFGDGTS
jgi:hypothetical protein